MDTPNANTTPRECAVTATTSTAEPKNPGTVPMINSTLTECVRIATSTPTTVNDAKNVQIASRSPFLSINPKWKIYDQLLIQLV